MPVLALQSSPPAADAEARAVLATEADGRTGSLAPEAVADHVLRVTQGGDFPLRRAALEALLRRVRVMRESSEAWRVEARPRGRSPLGLYRVSVGKGRSYRVLLRAVAPLAGSCSCPDFARSSLGACKHLLWLAEWRLETRGAGALGALPEAPLSWSPVRALTGPADWADGIRWTAGEVPKVLRPWFSARVGAGALKTTHAGAAQQRLGLVRALRGWAQAGGARELRVDPALEQLLADEADRLERRLDGALSPKALDAALRTLQRPLFPYQVEGVRRFLAAGRLLLADDMGLGKTAQAIAACHVLHGTGRARRGLVIVPAALKSQWLREWRLFTAVPAAVVDGAPEARARLYRETGSGFLIVNYEQVLKDLPLLQRFAPDLVVLDEAQRIKNWAAKTSLFIKRLEPRWRLVLSGTPLENRLTELASLMDWVDDLALEPKWRLPEWHAVRADGGREVVGARNLDTLRARLAGSTLRRVRKEVLSQLPPRSDTRVPVELTPEQAAAHEELDAPIARLVNTAQRRPLSQPEFLRLMTLMSQQRIICNGLAQRDFEQVWPELEQARRPTEARLRSLFSPKLLELRELVANLVLTQGRKVVVFSQWKRMLRLAQWAVSDVLAEAGLRAVFFTGDESQKRRTQNVVDFHDDEKTRIFFATDAGGVGLNLQRAASACVHLDLPWNPAVLEQRSGRIYRLGQQSPVEIYSLVAASGIEARIAGIVSAKKALFDGLFDGSSDEVRFEKGGSFLATLRELAAPPAQEPAPDAEDDDAVEPAPDLADSSPDAAPPRSPGALDFLAGIRVQRLDDGRMLLEAQPEAAATFAAMLEGVAALLKQAAPPPRAAGEK